MHTSNGFPSLVKVSSLHQGLWSLSQPEKTPASFMGMVLTSLGAGYLLVDREYRITDANVHALQWLNIDRNAVIGRPFSAIAPRSPMKMLRAAVEDKIFVDRQLPSYQRPDRLLDLHIYPTNDGAILFFQDVTEQKLQHQDAMRTRALLQSSLDACSAHLVVLDNTGAVVDSNAAWQEFAAAQGLMPRHGTARLNYVALYTKPFARRRDAQKIGATLTSLLRGHCSDARLVYTWPLAGKMHWFQLNAARVECLGLTYVVVANEDVTAVKEAQQASEETAERLLALQENERQRIADELHDSTAQHLTAVALNIMKLKLKLPPQERHSELFKEIETSVQEGSKELRTFTYLLHPPKLDEHGLRNTVEFYAQGFGNRTGLAITIRMSRLANALPFELQRCLFRVLQEALANIHRHASASQVKIELRYLRHTLHLLVCDNGVGLEGAGGTSRRISREPARGVGIPGMQERLRQVGGGLALRSGSGGTRIHAFVPFDAPSSHDKHDVAQQENASAVERGSSATAPCRVASRKNVFVAPALAER